MSRCIKTGGCVRVPNRHDSAELGTEWLYGDFHLVGTALVVVYPSQSGKCFGNNGVLWLPNSTEYLLRTGKPYNTLVVPARCVQWQPGALHEDDQLLFDLFS